MEARSTLADELIIVFADLQEGIVNVGATNDVEQLRMRVAALADLAVALAIPVVITSVPTTSGAVAPLLAEITSRLPSATALVRTTASAMDDPSFCTAVQETGRNTLILAGVATEVVVRLTALAARERGYQTIVAIDACSGLDERTEAATFTHLAARGVELSAVATIAAQLAGDFNSLEGRVAMRAFQSLLATHPHEHPHAHTPN